MCTSYLNDFLKAEINKIGHIDKLLNGFIHYLILGLILIIKIKLFANVVKNFKDEVRISQTF